jgi:hypothetical protein
LIDAWLGCKDYRGTLGFNIQANSIMVVKTIHDMAKKKILDYLSNVECSGSWIQYWSKLFHGGKNHPRYGKEEDS